MSLTRAEVREEIQLAFETMAIHARNERFNAQSTDAAAFTAIDTVARKTARSALHGQFCRGRIFSHVECNCGAEEDV